jgi:hypothetical protein
VILCALTALAVDLHIEVRDEHGSPIWTRLEVRGPDGKMYQSPGSIHENMQKTRGGKPYYLGSFIVNGSADLDVPAGNYTVIAEHGLEYARVERDVTVTAESPPRIGFRLNPWIRMRANGWWSGDMHVHHSAEDAPGIVQAEDLNFTVLVNRGKQDLFRPDHWPSQPVEKVSEAYWISLRNAEDERRGGSWILNGLNAPLTLGREGGWFPQGLGYTHEAHAQRGPGSVLPWFDIDMPFWWEVPVMVALGQPDSIDILHNQFMQYGIDQSEYWGRPRNRAEFPGWQGFVDYCMGLYYRFLNLGYRVPPSAGTGTGVMPSPTGYDRLYAHFDGAFSVEKWYRAIRDGQSFATNGPMLFVSSSASSRPGESSVRIDATAEAREPIDRMELVANGRIVENISAAENAKQMKASFRIDPRKYSWCAVRCFLKTPDNIRLAHSSPLYLNGKWDARDDAVYFVSWIDELIRQTMEDSTRFQSEQQRDEVLAVYRRAREIYQEKAR